MQEFLIIKIIIITLFCNAGSSGLLEFALIYDETASLLLVNILRAKVRTPY